MSGELLERRINTGIDQMIEADTARLVNSKADQKKEREYFYQRVQILRDLKLQLMNTIEGRADAA